MNFLELRCLPPAFLNLLLCSVRRRRRRLPPCPRPAHNPLLQRRRFPSVLGKGLFFHELVHEIATRQLREVQAQRLKNSSGLLRKYWKSVPLRVTLLESISTLDTTVRTDAKEQKEIQRCRRCHRRSRGTHGDCTYAQGCRRGVTTETQALWVERRHPTRYEKEVRIKM